MEFRNDVSYLLGLVMDGCSERNSKYYWWIDLVDLVSKFE